MQRATADPGLPARTTVIAERVASFVTFTLAAASVLALVAFAGTVGRGADDRAPSAPSPVPGAAPRPVSHLPDLAPIPEPGFLLVTSAENAAADLRTLVVAETRLRTLLGEAPRTAWVVVASSDAEARMIAEAASMDEGPHALPVITIVLGASFGGN
ncbi:MAG: hypothetical protein KJ053_12140 [Dehalococcoidia bacterium]|nr:hypothetical protein [Dehalococcoidia bacterium]